jgi:molybdenum cofactor cytidylyltransferase
MTSAVAVILAAGAGARLGGVNKAALRREDGVGFLEAILEACRVASCPAIVVAGPPHGEAVRALVGDAAPVVWNETPGRGMAASVAIGIAAAARMPVDGALVWPVDHAWVRAETVTAICRAAGRGLAVVPVLDGRGGHPTFFGVDLWPELVAAADASGGARAVLRRRAGAVVRLAVDDPGVRRDADVPADLT